ncbi:hypothetical protein DPV79_10600 [Burkholderia reimsis]|uniref:Uncharacterized protein n=1 Tax=Burkholderia reimsis TaxID=2234132 RepID=A0A365QZ77_9BURK|nr:hypothetical protein DPV79_10600 [Burkholderia reimsis]
MVQARRRPSARRASGGAGARDAVEVRERIVRQHEAGRREVLAQMRGRTRRSGSRTCARRRERAAAGRSICAAGECLSSASHGGNACVAHAAHTGACAHATSSGPPSARHSIDRSLSVRCGAAACCGTRSGSGCVSRTTHAA